MNKKIATLEALYNSTKSIRIFSAPDYSVLYFNNKACQQLKTEFNTTINAGDNISRIFEKKLLVEDFKTKFKEALGGNHIVDERLISTPSQKKWFKIEYHPVLQSDSFLGIALSIRDIDESKNRDLLIQRQNQLLKYLISSHSHKVRGPIASMLGLVKLFDEDLLSENNKTIVKYLETTVTSLDEELKRLIKEIYNTIE